VLGVSPDGVASHVKFKSKYNLPFTLLVDADHKIAEAYGVWGERSIVLLKFTGVIRSQFVIAPDGKILEAHYDVGAKESAQEALRAIG
jgi:peroxiredoxin Q/BCP